MTPKDTQNWTPYMIKFITEAKKSGTIRKTSFIHRLAKKGYIYGLSADKAMEYTEVIDKVITIFNNLYGNNWDFILIPQYTLNLGFKNFKLKADIIFPTIHIKNNHNYTHEIKDIVVRIHLNPFTGRTGATSIYVDNPTGTRLSLSRAEISSVYMHSHLPCVTEGKIGEFLGFCTGDSSSDLTSQAIEVADNFTTEAFEMYLWNLKSFLEWESLAPRPFMYMRNISEPSGIMYESHNIANYSTLLEDILESSSYEGIREADIAVVIVGGKYKIVENDNFSQFLKNVAIKNIENLGAVLCNKIGDSFYAYKTKAELSNLQIKEYSFNYVFRNKVIKSKVYNLLEFSEIFLDIENFNIHPKIVKNVKKLLEQRINEEAIKKVATQEYYQNQNVKRYLEQNSLLVPTNS